MNETPARRYYRAMHGSWRGRLSLALTDRSALASLPLMDRLAWWLTAVAIRIFGAPWLETSVEFAARAGQSEVIHTTRLRQFGMTLVKGIETIALDPAGGRRFTMRGAHRFAWAPWRAQTVSGDGEVNEAADGARYTFTYLGAALEQVTRRDGEDALVVTQATLFSHSEVRLLRRR